MNTQAAIFFYVSASVTIAIALLVTVPEFLVKYGRAIAWMWVSILMSWVLIEALHADFEDKETAK